MRDLSRKPVAGRNKPPENYGNANMQMDMFAERALLLSTQPALGRTLARAACQSPEAHLCFLDRPGEPPPELPQAVLEKLPGLPTSSQQEELELFSLISGEAITAVIVTLETSVNKTKRN